MSFASSMALCPRLEKIGTATKSSLIAITSAGVGKVFDTASTESIASEYWYGPVSLGNVHSEGIVTETTAVLSSDSNNVSWEWYVGDSAQEAFNSTKAFTGADWTRQGMNYWQNPKARGAVGYLRVSGTGTDRIALEEVLASITVAGKRRFG